MREKKIPTLIGLFVLIVGVAVGVFLVQNRQIFRLAASPQETPKDVRLTNISDSSFSVSWVTDQKTLGFVVFGPTSSLGQTARDDQDGEKGTPRLVHHVTVANLLPETAYFFKVGSGGTTFDKDGELWQVTTAPQAASLPATDLVSGKVQTEAGEVVAGAVVYISVPRLTSLSAITTASGNWSVSLATARSDDLSSFASYTEETPLSVFVQAGVGQIASAQATVAVARPLPVIILGQTHDFRGVGGPTSPGTSPKTELEIVPPSSPGEEATPSSGFIFESLETPPPASTPVAIENPQEGETITTTKPEFLGTGPAETRITIIIESPQTQTGVTTVGDDGNWSWTPPENLEPGEHLITLSWVDENSQKQTKSLTFVVAAESSEIPAFSATPSGETTPTPTPSPSPTASPSGRVSLPSTEGGVPIAGNLTATFLLFIMGIALVFTGTAALVSKQN